MDRRTAVAAATTGGIMVVAALAASSGPVEIWVNPPTDEAGQVQPSAPREPTAGGSTDESAIEVWPWLGTVFNVLGIALLVVLVVAFVKLAVIPRNPWVRSLRWRLGNRYRDDFEALPEVADRAVDLDVDAARATLAQGAPRNAIVACWMRLEGDAARVGLERLVAETSVEYTERVVASSSVDPAPIGQLALLYREARFSVHDMDDRHRDRALSALGDIERALAAHAEAAR